MKPNHPEKIYEKKIDIPKKMQSSSGAITPNYTLNQQIMNSLKDVEKALDYSTFNLEEVSEILKTLYQTKLNSDSFLTKIQEKLLKSRICSKCHSQDLHEFVTNTCGHCFCIACASQDLKSSIFNCQVCDRAFSDDFKISISKKNPEIKIFCKMCGNTEALIRDSPDFCGHLCRNCFYNSFKNLENQCFYCDADLLRCKTILEEQYYCDSCESQRYIFGDNIKIICGCGKGTLCITCREKVLKEKQCPGCKRAFTALEMLQVTEETCEICCKCKKLMSKSNLIPRYCCKKQICFECFESQSNNCC